MTLCGWLDLLDDCHLITWERNIEAPLRVEEAKWCYIWSQDLVSDHSLRERAAQQLTFVGFMEALCRIILFVRLSTPETAQGMSSKGLQMQVCPSSLPHPLPLSPHELRHTSPNQPPLRESSRAYHTMLTCNRYKSPPEKGQRILAIVIRRQILEWGSVETLNLCESF